MTSKYSHKQSKSKYLAHMYDPAKYSSPLKRSMSGYEMEMCLITEKGDVSNSSETIIEQCKKFDKDFPIKKEVGKNMVEVIAMPYAKIQKSSMSFIRNIRKVLDICEKNNLYLMPLGAYPGTFKEDVWKKKRYLYPAKAIGEKKYFYYYSRLYSFHYHYTLPKGVFDKEKKVLNKKSFSRIGKTVLDSYNLLIAADPIITTLAQSSPFESGKYYAKDTRIIFLRGGRRLKFDGLYNDLQFFGGLQPYKETMYDLISTLDKKDKKFKKLLKKSGAPESYIENKDKLDLVWNPVKINRLGTIEQRGMDTNYLDVSLSICVMMKFILRAIHQEFYNVVPSDVGIKEPFKLEGNAIFIPPHSYVRNKLQYKSAYYGLSDENIYKACLHFYNLARKLVYKEYLPMLKPIKDIINKRETVSDDIISYVKKKGYSIDNKIPQEISRKIALYHCKRMVKNMEKTMKNYENLEL
ncbi:MAG: hypothetical protein V1831_02655 [Candidatus Woesearchaeota archaeon]